MIRSRYNPLSIPLNTAVTPRIPWWMYLVAAVYLLTFFFNLRQEFWGPAAPGWIGVGLKVERVTPGSAVDHAGLKAGDVLEAVDGHPLNGMPDWFLARANFEVGRPVILQVARGDQHLQLTFVITGASGRQLRFYVIGGAVYSCRFIPLVIAMFLVFTRPNNILASFAALMLATAAVAEGYPSSGWAATLHHLPGVLAIPISLATESWLLAPLAWLTLFAQFPRPWLARGWRWGLTLLPLLTFLPPFVASAVAMTRAPWWTLSAPWFSILSHAPIHMLESMAGVAPLLFLNRWPLYQPITQAWLLELWFTLAILYLIAGFVMLAVNYRRLEPSSERQRIAALLGSLAVLGIVVFHNFFVRNWTIWFGSAPPAFFSGAAYVVEAILFQLAPITLAYAVWMGTDGVPGKSSAMLRLKSE